MEASDRYLASLNNDDRFRLLVEAVTDYAIYMLDPRGIVSSWNPGARRFKGYETEEILGQHFSRFYTEEDRAAGVPERGLEQARNEGRFETEGWRVRKDGTRFWAHVIIDVIRDPQGAVSGFAKVTKDITEKRDAALALEQAREQLFQSQKMEALGQLTGGIAHDFNNLLMAILSSVDLVRKRVSGDPALIHMLDAAAQAADRGVSLVQRMLAFARAQQLSVTSVDIVALVRGMSELINRSLGPTISVAMQFPLSLPPVTTDPNQLELAILNLAVNARDAMPRGGSISIESREEKVPGPHPSGLQPGRYVCLSVSDTGEGMNEATLARAAEPFFTTKGVGKGTGLGLSAVHGVAEQSGGRLLLRSREGEGTVAEIWLPVAEAASATLEASAADQTRSAQASVEMLSVLVVDDDPVVLVTTAAMLEDLGHTVQQAESGKRALEILREGHGVDVLITDQAMPQMTGVELVGVVQSERPNLPIILATGYADTPRVPVDVTTLRKPYRQEHLAVALAGAIESRPSG